MDVDQLMKEKSEMLEKVLGRYTKIGDKRIQEMMLHPINAGGKRIRPCLVLLACEAVKGDSKKILPAAASVELLHTFTLIHDDIMDHDTERRGKPTVHAIWGEELAIVVGDTLYSGAFKALVEVRKNGVPENLVLDAVEALVEANSELQEGQILDMLFEERETISEGEYMKMIGKKTGSLIEASLKIGGILGNGTREELSALSLFGRNAGIAFQIKDDLLDLTADQVELGKPVGSDIRKGKKTLMIVHALNHTTPRQRQEMNTLLGNENATDEDIHDMIGLLQDLGSINYAEEKVKTLIDEGKNALKTLDETEAKKTLLAMSDYLINRRK
jgi:geranylgeranyl diphosphate synthase type I